MVDVKHPNCLCGKKMKRMYIKIDQKLVSVGWYCLVCGLLDNDAPTVRPGDYIENCIKGMKVPILDTCIKCDKKNHCPIRARAFPNYVDRNDKGKLL